MRKKAATLVEVMVVVSIIALLATIGIPAIKALYASFEISSCSKVLINSLLARSKAVAAKEQNYSGVNFERRVGTQWAMPVIQDLDPSHVFRPDPNTIVLMPTPKQQEIKLGNNSVIAPEGLVGEQVVILFSPSGRLIIKQVTMYPQKTFIISQRGFVIYDVKSWESCKNDYEKEKFVKGLKPLYINTYTGRIIE